MRPACAQTCPTRGSIPKARTLNPPPWFLEAFDLHCKIAGLTDPALAADKFWRQIIRHERFPSPEQPSLTGDTGWRYVCPEGKDRGHALAWAGKDGSDQRHYWCQDCQRFYALMDNLTGEFVAIDS